MKLVYFFGISIVGKISIITKKSPKAIGPYSQAVKVTGGLTFTSGQIPLDKDTGKIISEKFEIQTTQVLKNIRGIVEERKCELADIVKLTVYLVDMSNFNSLNNIFENFFNDGNYPARTVIEVSGLPKKSKIEIEAIFYDKNNIISHE